MKKPSHKLSIGRTIAGIRQSRIAAYDGLPAAWSVTAIELDDGSVLVPSVVETGTEYGVKLIRVPPQHPKP